MTSIDQLDKSTLEDIRKEEQKILYEEKMISHDTDKLLKTTSFIKKEAINEAKKQQEVEKELNKFQRYFIKRAKDHKFIFQLIIVAAVVLVGVSPN